MTFIEILQSTRRIPLTTLSIGCILSLYLYKQLDSLHKGIFLYLLLMLATDILGKILPLFYGNNLIVLHIYSTIELIFFLHFYNKFLFSKPSKILIAIGIVGCIYIVAEMLQYFVFNSLNIKQFQPYAKVVDNFIIILMALVFFYKKMKDFKETKWGDFRLNTVILVLFTFNTIIFLPFNFMVNESSGVKFYFWTGNMLLLVGFYIYLTSLIWKNASQNRIIAS